jgi:hypothetical protein
MRNPNGIAVADTDTLKLYTYEIIAKTGQSVGAFTFSGMGNNVSINDSGKVAFVGQLGSSGEGVFIGDGSTSPSNITVGFQSSTRVFGSSVQINNTNQVLARDRVSGSPPPSLVRIWDGNSTSFFTTIARGGLPGNPYDSVFTQPSFNNNASSANPNPVVFTALRGATQYMATPINVAAQTYNEVAMPGSLRPMMADTGNIVVRAGSTSASPVQLYNQSLGLLGEIAYAGNGFTSLGQSPGISDDGKIIAFTGDRGNGIGIFVSVDRGSSHRIISVAGESFDGSECSDRQLGADHNGASICFSNFEIDSRVGVANFAYSVNGSTAYSFVVSFIATPSAGTRCGAQCPNPQDYYSFSNQKGIWAVRIDVENVLATPRVRVFRPVVIAQIGDVIDGRTINGLAVYDQIAKNTSPMDLSGNPRPQRPGDHRVSFWASTDLGNMVVRATPLDCQVPNTYWNQHLGPWSGDTYDSRTDGATMAGKGCALTCLAMALDLAGVKTIPTNPNVSLNPGTLNIFMTMQSGRFGHAGDIVYRNTVKDISGNQLDFHAFDFNSSSTADLENALCKGFPVIVGVKLRQKRARDISGQLQPVFRQDGSGNRVPDMEPGHFVLVTGKRDDQFLIADPYHTDRTFLDDASYGTGFRLRGYVYNPDFLEGYPGFPTSPSAKVYAIPEKTMDAQAPATFINSRLNISTASNVEVLLTDPNGNRTGFDPITASVLENIPGSSYFTDTLDDDVTDAPDSETNQLTQIDQPAEGSYTLTITGQDAGAYEVLVRGYAQDGSALPPISIQGNANPGSTESFQFTYSNCRFSLSQSSQFFPMSGGQGGVDLTAPGGCNWLVSTDVPWITVTSDESGTGSAPVTFEVRENFTSSARQGSIVAGGQVLIIVQDGGLGDDCNYSISPLFTSFPSSGGFGTVTVLAEERCAWQALSGAGWVTLSPFSVGIGNGTVTYSVAPNPGGGRKAVITIAGKTFAVKQKGL